MDDLAYIESLKADGRSSNIEMNRHDLKNRFLYPFFPMIIVDDFYDDPDLIRHFALKQEYYKGERGSWPGLRSPYINEINLDLFENLKKKLLLIFRDYGYSDFIEVQTTFQLIDETYGTGWVHDDDPKLNIAGLIYLNPTAPESGSGTTLYEDNNDFDGEKYADAFMEDVLISSDEDRKKFNKLRQEQKSQFKPTVTIENVYNRCIIFDTRQWHSADGFFGKDKENTRLTQVFFVKAI